MNIKSIESQEDQRLNKKDLCGVTTIVGGKEFICIREAHAPIYERKTLRTRDVFGGFISNNRQIDQHYFVRRYSFGDH